MDSNSYNKYKIWLPLIFAIILATGIFIGNNLNFGSRSDIPGVPAISFKGKNVDKLSSVINYILKEYVDSLDQKKLEDDAIIALLEQLDPHSSYIPAKELASYTEPLEGNFDGIGIEFNIQRDTILVVAAISGGPSEALGIQSGDRIIKVDDELVAGVGITNEQVMKKLRGKRNTKVKVSILRKGKNGLIDFNITRGQIPIFSVDVHYMLTNDIGYIKISRFAATTFREYLEAFDALKEKGMKKLVLDLRDNPGGYLTAAVDLSDEFLDKGKQIVYTQGNNRKREDFTATSRGGFEKGALVVLVDEGSASASEIVAGAVQDNDRGWVVGRRSFGKGLVQEEIRFQDGSAMRLTIARYYTPTGRSIQKPYDKGNRGYYEQLIEQLSGETTKKDSLAKDSTVYVTPGGRTVYGGGGIYPDYIVERDTSGYSKMLSEIARKGLINQFALNYADQNRNQLMKAYPDAESFQKKFDANNVMPDFRTYVTKEGINYSMTEEKLSVAVLQTQVKAFIGRALHGNKGFFPVLHERDPAIKKSLELLQKNRAIF
ncbi:MAG: S41 family peptidase [Flavobacteriales bacterium]